MSLLSWSSSGIISGLLDRVSARNNFDPERCISLMLNSDSRSDHRTCHWLSSGLFGSM